MLYVLTQTPGFSSLGWSPTGIYTTWTTHHQNGDNLIYYSCTLGTYRGCLLHFFALIKGHGVITGVRSFTGYTEEILVCVPDSHELQTHITHTHTHIFISRHTFMHACFSHALMIQCTFRNVNTFSCIYVGLHVRDCTWWAGRKGSGRGRGSGCVSTV